MYEKDAIQDKGDESFQTMFWKQQLQALSLKNSCQIQWHPLIIRWALYLHHQSNGAYETLQNSGVIALLTSKTLRDYWHLISSSSSGFSATADEQLVNMIKNAKLSHLTKYILILIDEIYLKEGLVYNKSTGSLVGFSDLGSALQQLSDYEDSLSAGANTRSLG